MAHLAIVYFVANIGLARRWTVGIFLLVLHDVSVKRMDDKEKNRTKSFNRTRMQRALKSGDPITIPLGLSREELRQFIINSGKKR